jgi:3-dehydroquinate dehydratase II
MQTLLVIHGPNLNMLGSREPEIYGHETLADIDGRLAGIASAAGVGFHTFQSNHEGALIDRIHLAKAEKIGMIVINPGAFTHTSIALRDALTGVAVPFIEIHLSNIHAREPFRKHSYLSDKAIGVICGLGARGYDYAVTEAVARLNATGKR